MSQQRIDLISAKAIAARIRDGRYDQRETFSDSEKLIVIGLLRGSFMFTDFVRELELPVEVNFLETRPKVMRPREVRILKDLSGEIEGGDILVVEDIVDTGHTLFQVVNMLASRRPRRMMEIHQRRRDYQTQAPSPNLWEVEKAWSNCVVDCASKTGEAHSCLLILACPVILQHQPHLG